MRLQAEEAWRVGEHRARIGLGEAFAVKQLENAIEHGLDIVSGEIISGANNLGSKAELFSKKVHDLVDKELESFLEEIRA